MFVSVNWKARTKDYKFYNEKFIHGIAEPTLESFNRIDFKVEISKKDLVSKDERLIFFTVRVKLLPACGEFAFDGEMIIESPDQKTIELLLDKSDSFKIRVEYNIIKRVYPLAEKIAKEQGLFLIPSDMLLKELREIYSRRIIEYDEMAKNFNI